MRSYLFKLIIFSLVVSLSSCKRFKVKTITYQELNDSIKSIYASDGRVALYNISLRPHVKYLLLSGESDQPKAVALLKQKLDQFRIPYLDSISLLPDESIGETKYAVVNNSVANIRSKPKHSAELATQVLLGTGLKILKINGGFYLVQVPDGYISWVDHGGVVLMNDHDYSLWSQSQKIIYTKRVGSVYQYKDENAEILSDIVLGAQLKLLNAGANYYEVEYPDKRIGYIKINEAEVYRDWVENVEPSGELIEKYSREFLGSPYLWGGTSSKGMDCSGFTKTVYLMNGFIIPRDASQQINAGKDVDKDLTFENLEKGDLMFFGTKAIADKKQRVTHVGIWLGNEKGEFIHSASQVRLSSINPSSDYYDEANTNRYLGSRRYLGNPDKLITNLKKDKVLTDLKP
jgi:hypothetical protein